MCNYNFRDNVIDSTPVSPIHKHLLLQNSYESSHDHFNHQFSNRISQFSKKSLTLCTDSNDYEVNFRKG